MADNIITKIMKPSARGKVWRNFVLIIVLLIFAGGITGGNYYNKVLTKIGSGKLAIKEVPFRLGLDLVGGTHLVYQADVSKIDSKDKVSAVEGVRDVIERRVNAFGVSEPVVQTNFSGDNSRVIVELAGVSDVNQAIKMIGETPLLEFKEQSTETPQTTDAQKKELDAANKSAENRAADILGKLNKGGSFEELAKQFSEDEATKATGGDMGYVTETQNGTAVSAVKNLKNNQITKDIVKESDGYYIYKLTDKRNKTNPFDEKQVEKEVKAAHILICYDGSDQCTSGLTKDQAKAKIESLKKQATPQNFSKLAKENSTEPGAAQSGGELGWFGFGAMVKPFEDTVFPQKTGTISYVVETKFGYHLIYKEAERTTVEYKISQIKINKASAPATNSTINWKNTELTGKNLKRASVTYDPNDNMPQISLEFDEQGAKMFADITERNVGKPVGIFLDKNSDPISAPTVNEKIPDGKAVINGNFSIAEAKLLVQRLNAGALPVPISLLSQQTIGASLGQQSVRDSLKAGLIGFALVALFMVLFYRLPGMLSIFALGVYAVLSLMIFKIFNVTLSLAGMAGFIMSMGVAVDANILVFARLREELSKGEPLNYALEESFVRAWPSIFDSNLSTIITCLILIMFSTSIVKGFAVTLLIGVVVSLFTSIVVTRNFLRLIPSSWLEKTPWLIGVPKR